MWNKIKHSNTSKLVCSLLFVFLLYMPSACFGQERVYKITETQLSKLEQALSTVEASRSKSVQAYEKQKQVLTEARQALNEVSTELGKQKTLVLKLQLSNQELQEQLKTAEQSFQLYDKQQKAKVKKLKTERTIAWTTVLLLILSTAKK